MVLWNFLPSLQTTGTLLVLVFTLGAVYYIRMLWRWKRLGIRGPTPMPILGNIHSMIQKGLTKSINDQIKEYGTVSTLYMGSREYLLIADVDILKQVLVKEFNKFTNHTRTSTTSPTKNLMTMIEDDHWKHVRTTLTPTFSGNKLKQMMVHINRCADNLVKKMDDLHRKDEPLELYKYTSNYTMDVIAGTAFGIQLDCQNDENNPFIANMKGLMKGGFIAMFKRILLFSIPTLNRIMNKFGVALFDSGITDFFVNVVEQAIANRRENPSERTDFLQLALDSYVGDPKEEEFGKDPTIKRNHAGTLWSTKGLTREDLMSQAIIFFLAGNETTALTLSFVGYNLATNMDVQEKLIQEIDEVIGEQDATYELMNKLPYLEKVIQETLRMYPIAPRTDRICKETTTINGVTIPKDVGVFIPICYLHYIPEIWPDPEKFDPERFSEEAKAARDPYYYLPFGLGPRSCIGLRLAMLEMKVVLVRIIQKYKFLPCEKTEVPLKLEKFRTKALNGINLKLEKRMKNTDF